MNSLGLKKKKKESVLCTFLSLFSLTTTLFSAWCLCQKFQLHIRVKHVSQISFKRALLISQRTTQATVANHIQDFREERFSVVLKFHRECWDAVKSYSKALVAFAVSKQIPVVYSADRGWA